MTKMIPTDNAAFLNAFGMIVGGDTGLNASARRVEIVRIAQSTSGSDVDYVAEEVPIALVYNGISHAVMMATPAQLEEFGIGFSLAEGIVADLSEIYGIEVTEGCRGGKNIELTIASENFWKLKEYRRSMTGRTGCGICGVESLEGAVRPTPRVPFTQTFDLQHYERALNYLHEIVQKAAMTGVEIIFAVSAPTALAIEVAQKAGITLAAFCRRGRANVYTHPERLIGLGEQA